MPGLPPKISDQAYADKLAAWAPYTIGQTVNYSFNDNSDAGYNFSSEQKAAIETALKQLEDLFGLTFTKVSQGNSDLTFSAQNGPLNNAEIGTDAAGVANVLYYFPSQSELSSTDVGYGSRFFTTTIHEVLHGMGLGHPGAYNGGNTTYLNDAEQRRDTEQYSVMSYFIAGDDGSGTSNFFKFGGTWKYVHPSTPQLLDLLALTRGDFDGSFAGFNFSSATRSGDTRYGYKVKNKLDDVFDFKVNEAPVVTIFDGGGMDTLDLSGDKVRTSLVLEYDNNFNVTNWVEVTRKTSVIDLREGKFSSTNGMTDKRDDRQYCYRVRNKNRKRHRNKV